MDIVDFDRENYSDGSLDAVKRWFNEGKALKHQVDITDEPGWLKRCHDPTIQPVVLI
jgi:hypothetical protein